MAYGPRREIRVILNRGKINPQPSSATKNSTGDGETAEKETMNSQASTLTNCNESEWEGPVSGLKSQRLLEKNYPPLRLRNSFEPLASTSELEQMDTATAEPNSNVVRASNNDVTKEKMPPPIIVHGFFKKHARFTARLQGEIGKHYTVKFTKFNTNIHTKNKKDWVKVQEILKHDNIEFHTYTHKDNKTHAFVLRGLDQKPELEDIAEALKTEQIAIINIYNMRATNRPAYLVVTDNTITMAKLDNIKYVLNTKITWHRHMNSKVFVQCHRCQKWGHATANCHARPRCLKCAEEHLTRECPIDRTDTPRCANCSGNHTANNIECPVYIQKLDAAQEKRTRRNNISDKSKLVPAPPPARNAWEKRTSTTGHEATPTHNRTTDTTIGDNPQAQQSNTMNLLTQIKELNNLCNINNLIRALTDLNKLLRKTTTSEERFMTVLQFTQNVASYNI
ncbi:hypothetical protein MTP99_014296 [Tenebrio molitor]|jgi:uncharacterized protein YeaO (DUF488 family)|nr:hypothetical protein MTP99_014296 [Tenebrio molitor]